MGLRVRVILTEDPELLGRSEEHPSFARYDVIQSTIWLDSSVSDEMLQSLLFHEVYEFTLAYMQVVYNSDNEHESFMRFSNVLWCVFRANQDLLFGEGLSSLLESS